jgi:hypothetical protein
VSPLSTGLVMVRVLHAPFGSHAFLLVLPVCQGFITWALLPQRSWGGENSTGGGGAILVADGIPSGLCRAVLNCIGLGLVSEQCHRAHSFSCAAPMECISTS